jgi:signal transduction histidine kinase
LAIVRKIVDAHDGRIDVTPRPGGGTAFRVTLPLAGEQQLFQ